MPDITDPQVVAWANERARTIADALVAFEAKLGGWQADYAAQSIASQISAAGASEIVADWDDFGGVTKDGRPRITGNQIINLHAAIAQVRTAISTTLVSGVGLPPKTIADAIQVNGSPR
jgi:hypothetical protein